MTIAACYVSPEGVVLGADSTGALPTPDGLHFFNHNQKLFEIGENGTLGVVTWGMGGLGARSYRSILADICDDFGVVSPTSVEKAANTFSEFFWKEYLGTAASDPQKQRFDILHSKPPFGDTSANARSIVEESEYNNLTNALTVGFCIGGYVSHDRKPAAYTVIFAPSLTAKPAIMYLAKRPNLG